jgi:predicted RNA-binding Zn ribbon-like protein
MSSEAMGLMLWDEAGLRLRTGRLCLDFCNTVEWHAGPSPVERIDTYADLSDWARQVGLLSQAASERLARHAQRHARAAEAVRGRAITLREAVYRTLAAHAHGRVPDPADLAVLNVELPQALARARLRLGGVAYRLTWDLDGEALDGLLWPIAYSAANLLATPELLARVGQCADDRGCGWLFLDMTKNRSRRWCDMKDCGNRAKARRHYQRVRGKVAA